MKFADDVAGKKRLNRLEVSGRCLLDYGHFVVFRKVVDQNVEHESVELRFGQRIGAFHFDRVLRRQHKEWFVQRVALSRCGDLMFLHCFQQSRLSLWWGAVNFICKQHIGKNGARNEPHRSATSTVFFQNFSTSNVGWHQVGRKLDSVELEVEQLSDGLDEKCLRQSRCSGDQTVAASQQGNQQLPDNILLADDDSGQFSVDLFSELPQNPNEFAFAIRGEFCVVGH